MELFQLRYFTALAEELHFSRAAERLHIAQPALSQQLKKLEREVGCQLLERDARSCSLTEAGRTLYAGARSTLDQADSALEAVRGYARGEAGTLTVGVVGEQMAPLAYPVVAAFRADFPRVRVRVVQVGLCDPIVALLDQRSPLRVDVVLLRGPLGDERIHEETLAIGPRAALVPADSSLARAAFRTGALDLPTLLEQPFAPFSPAAPLSWREHWWAVEHRDDDAPPCVGRAEVGAATCAVELYAAVAFHGCVTTWPAPTPWTRAVSWGAKSDRGAAETGVVAVPVTGLSGSPVTLASSPVDTELAQGQGHSVIEAFWRVARRCAPQVARQLPGGWLPGDGPPGVDELGFPRSADTPAASTGHGNASVLRTMTRVSPPAADQLMTAAHTGRQPARRLSPVT